MGRENVDRLGEDRYRIDDTPTAVSSDENRIDVIALGTNGHLLHKHFS